MTPKEHTATHQYTWPVPSPADVARAAAGIHGDARRGLPPKTGDALIFLAAVHAFDTTPGPDDPIPFTLTPKAHATLDTDGPVMDCGCSCGYDDCTACAGYGWACLRCGLAFFGTPPEHGLCGPCHASAGEQ
jgi:hypothetical protein